MSLAVSFQIQTNIYTVCTLNVILFLYPQFPVVCIFLAVGLEKAAIPYWVTWLIVVYSVIYILSHIILTVDSLIISFD
jgi:hypothetical protein